MRGKLTIGLMLAALTLPACSSKQMSFDYKLESRQITVQSEPSGATVYQYVIGSGPGGPSAAPVQRVAIGTTPMEGVTVMVVSKMKVKNASPQLMTQLMSRIGVAEIEVAKDGYDPVKLTQNLPEDEVTSFQIELIPNAPTAEQTAVR